MSERICISVIVPVYNVEQYLSECVNSIIEQDFNHSYEIILVDDGSEDTSGQICDKYVDKYPYVKVVHQKNQGLSAARNAGVSMSKGEYITFIDSDDVVSNDYLSVIYEGVLRYSSDLVITKLQSFIDKQDYGIQKNDQYSYLNISTENALKDMCNGLKFGSTACGKLYKRKLVEDNPYPVGKLYEDLATTYLIVGSSEKIVYCTKVIYFYRQRNGSIRHQTLSEQQLFGLEAAERQKAYIESKYPNIRIAAEARCVLKAFEFLPMLMDKTKDNKSKFKYLKNYCKPYRIHILFSNQVPVRNKIKCILMSLNYSSSMIISRFLMKF